MKKRTLWIALLLSGVLVIGVAGCEREGPMEEAGEEMDEAVEQARENAEQVTEETGEALEEAGEEVQNQ